MRCLFFKHGFEYISHTQIYLLVLWTRLNEHCVVNDFMEDIIRSHEICLIRFVPF